MKNSLKQIFTIGLILFTVFTIDLNAQDFKMKFGKINMEDLKMTKYDKDTSASAVVLGELGDIDFQYNKTQGYFEIIFKRHTRIKILNKNGYRWADHEISLYDDNKIEERVASLKAYTYNLEKGKLVKDKLTKGSQFEEKKSKYWNAMKFTMPNVREGSIIEYTYTIKSNYRFRLPEWYFQYTIPVRWSELNVETPEYYIYKKWMKGYEALDINEQTRGNKSIQLVSKTRETPTMQGSNSPGTEYNRTDVKYKTNIYRMVAKDVPAFDEEPMTTSIENYISKINFELSTINWPNTPLKHYTESWESINKILMENENFGKQLNGGAFLNDKAEQITTDYTEALKKMVLAYEFIRNRMKWDGSYGKYSTASLRSAYNDKEGSAGDINLMLTLMLKKVGLKADPVVLSTRSNGIINSYNPVITQFNYVIAHVNIDGKDYLLDATDPLCTFNILPPRCLNGKGFIVSKQGYKWIDLNPDLEYKYTTMANLKINEEGELIGYISNSRKDYAAYSLRKQIEKEKNEDEFIEEIENDNPGLTIENYKYTNIDSIYKPIKEYYEVIIGDKAEMVSDFIYFNPMLFEQVENNPFKLKERKYPVDFSYPIKETYVLNLEVPDGYIVDELPASFQLQLPGNSAAFSYMVNTQGNRIQLLNKIFINKPVFIYDEYSQLVDFYNKIVEKHAEQIVFKKITEPIKQQ